MTLIEYDEPYAEMTDRAATLGRRPCSEANHNLLCTRPAGHDGNHEAGIHTTKYAEWSDEPS